MVLIPNSVGPGELLLHYGTREQQDHYLPRLACGVDIPCFALTEPTAGSDAASLGAERVVEAGVDGTPWLTLDFEKRYITLAPVATLIGLACRLRDPGNLLGQGLAPGITVVLLPAATPGVDIGRRHDPLGVPFPNGPISGRTVRVPASHILGGPTRAGQGWRMLMEALSAGRAISLPAQSAGGTRMVARLAGAHARLREQFGLPIGRFEGVAEPLARLAGFTYLIEAARVYTCAAVDRGERPAVISAAIKQGTTELCRRAVADGMDVMAGNAICRGPHNRIADGWLGAPIGITVEGANILTRTLITFGQGVVRSHPWVRRALAAVDRDADLALVAAVGGHLASFSLNLVRHGWLAVSRGGLGLGAPGLPADAPPRVRREIRRSLRGLRWGASRFVLVSDLALVALGGNLKRRGALCGRLADALTWLFLATAALRRFLADGARADDLPLLRWSLAWSRWQLQLAFDGVAANLPGVIGIWLRWPARAWWRLNPLGAPPSDADGMALAGLLQMPGEARDRLTGDLYLPSDPDSAVGRLEHALAAVHAAAPLLARLRQAERAGRLPGGGDRLPTAVAAGVLDRDEAQMVATAEAARFAALTADSFDQSTWRARLAPAPGPAPST